MKRLVLLGVVAICGAALLASCSAAPSAQQQPSTAHPVTVHLLTHDSFAVSPALITGLKARGINLQIDTGGDAGTVVAGAIVSAGNPSGDVLFGVDNSLVAKAVNAKVFAPYRSPALSQVIPALAAQTDGNMVTPIDFGNVCVNVDDAWFTAHHQAAPASLADLAAPAYRDEFVVEDPGTSSPGMAFMLATIAKFGTNWTGYWRHLVANGVKIASTWTDAYEGSFSASGKGDRPIVVSYATDPAASLYYAAKPAPASPTTHVITDGCYRQVEYAGVLAGTPQSQAAGQVVSWLLSPAVQADIPLQMWMLPARRNVPLPKLITSWAAPVPHPLELPPGQVAAKTKSWLDTWDQITGR